MFDGTGDPKVHLRNYCDKLVGIRKDKKIWMKLFLRSLIGDALSWYIRQNLKKWSNWVSMASNFMDRFRLNTENTPDVFYIQNLKKKPTESFCEYATRWRSEAAKVRPSLDEEEMNKFFVRAQDPQCYKRLMVNPIKTCAYHSGMKGKTTDECRTLKDKIHTLIDNNVIQAKEVTPNVCNNPLPNNRGDGTQAPIEVEVTASVPSGVEVAPPSAAPVPFEVEMVTPFTVIVSTTPPFNSKAIPLDYVSGAWRKGKAKNSEAHKNALMKVLSEAYVPNNITGGEMANMVCQVLECHNIIFHEDEIPPEGLNHNRSLHITMQFENKFIARVLVDGGSSLNIYPLDTLKRLDKGFHEIRVGNMNVKAFNGSQRATIAEINLFLQMGPTWFGVEFQVLDILASYNLLLGRPWIHVAGVVPSTLHQAVKFE
ncbi:uncharacterized protein [Nicotiana sylvestris]|uniref:uncharacterized protein n=1 Tax=Nicotiana sylvestris TaxID=4096 RepID=UPI00388CC38F